MTVWDDSRPRVTDRLAVEKEFDRIHRDKRMDIKKNSEIDCMYLLSVQHLFGDQTTYVRADGGQSEEFKEKERERSN